MESESERIYGQSQRIRRRKQTSSKKGEIIVEPKPKNHSYSLRTISISLQEIIISGNSFRGVAKNWSIEIRENQEARSEIEEKVPSYSVIRQWLGKIGLYELQIPKAKRDDWIWIVDFTIELGAEKCLVILGVSAEFIQEKIKKSNGCLSHKDVEVLAREIMSSTKGEKVESVLEKLGKKVGIPQQIISDKGSDLYKGIKLYQEKHQKIIHSHDITHQMALLIKKELEAEGKYELFTKKCHQARQQIQQTELGFLMPPQQRSKSRYFNLDELIGWGIKIINYLEKQEENEEKAKKLELKLGWVQEYKESLIICQEMLSITRSLEEKIKQEGLSQDSYEEFEQNCQTSSGVERINKFREKIQEYLTRELSMIGEDEIRIISTDVIESLFGKYKSFSQKSPLKEIRRMILTIPIATLEITRELINKALSTVKNVDVEDWELRTFGQSTLSKRKIAFNS